MQPQQQPSIQPSNQVPAPKTLMSDWKRRLFISALLVIALLTVVLVIRNNQTTPSTSEQKASDQASQVGQVNITSEGFDPATVTIKKGQTIIWTNTDDAQHRIASDPHPTDDALADLNDDIPLEKGDSFTYVFDTAGTFTYHDELNPLKFNGTVIVQE